MNWQLQEAKNRFSAVVNAAQGGEPQIITRHGKETAVVVAMEDYRKLRARRGQRDLVSFLRASPLAGLDIPPRDRDDAYRDLAL